MKSDDLVFLLIAFPLLGAALVSISNLFHSKMVRNTLSVLAALCALVLPWIPLYQLAPQILQGHIFSGTVGGWYGDLGIEFKFDGLAFLITLLGMLLCLPAWIYSRGMRFNHRVYDCIYFIQLAFLAASAMTADLFNLFVCLEVLGMTSYVLIIFSKKPQAFLASLSYLFVSAGSMLIYLLGVYVIYNITGSLSYTVIAERIRAVDFLYHKEATIGLVLMVSSIALRVAVVPVYGWLPDAHAMAPHPVSAILSGVLIKTPLFILLRLVYVFPEHILIGKAFAYSGALTAVLGVLLALSQSDAKRLLAYHSVSQIGYVVAAWGGALSVGISTPQGIALASAAFLHALFHGIFKGTLFLAVGTVTTSAHSTNVYSLRGGSVLVKNNGINPYIVIAAYCAGALSITALPPWSGFISKNFLLYVVKDPFSYWMLTLASIGTIASFIKLSKIFTPQNKVRLQNPKQNRFRIQDQNSPAPYKGETKNLAFIKTPSISREIEEVHYIHWALIISAVLCLAGGLAGPFLFSMTLKFIIAWLAPGSTALAGPDVYSLAVGIKTLSMILLGALSFAAIQLKPIHSIMAKVAHRRRTFSGLFLAFFLGTAALLVFLQ
jgi:multicomponent Na+:H+ antiporter subunit D